MKQLFLNSSISTAILFGVKLLSLYFFITAAKLLGPEQFGSLVYFSTLLSLITLISDAGLIQWFQVQAHHQKTESLLQSLGQTRWLTILISILVSISFFYFTQSFAPKVILIFLITLIPEAFLSISDAYYLVERKPLFLALKQGCKTILPLLYILLFPEATFNSMATVLMITSVLIALIYTPTLLYSLKKFSLHKSLVTLKQSSHYALLIVTSAAYSRADALTIEYSLGKSSLAFYSAAYRYIEAVALFPATLAQQLFHISANKDFPFKKLTLITGFMFLMGTGTALLMYAFSPVLTVRFMGPEYLMSTSVLQILSLAIILFFVNAPLSTTVQSSSLVKKFLPWGITNTLLNVMLNVALVPRYGILAAAYVMLLTEGTGLLINLYFVYRKYLPAHEKNG